MTTSLFLHSYYYVTADRSENKLAHQNCQNKGAQLKLYNVMIFFSLAPSLAPNIDCKQDLHVKKRQ